MLRKYLDRRENGLRTFFLGTTALGVAIHEFAHVIVLFIFNIRIRDVTFFQFGVPVGYVTHDQPHSAFAAFFVAVAPLFMNLGVATSAFWAGTWLAGHTAITTALQTDSLARLAAVIGFYQFGLSASVHAIPSQQDVHSAVDVFTSQWWNPLVLLLFPLLGGVYVLTVISRYHAHLLIIPITACCGVWIAIERPTLSDASWVIDILI